MEIQNVDTIIIGGGPAGLFAGIHCTKGTTLLLEKTGRIGNKLLISGAGRCNLTHTGPISAFFDKYGEHQHFIKHALKTYTNTDVLSFFSRIGLTTTTDKNGKVFPASQQAEEVRTALIQAYISPQRNIHYHQPVIDITHTSTHFLVTTEKNSYQASCLVIATGGLSYPATGSTGDGYKLAKKLGHKITPLKPALTPIYVKENLLTELAGVSLTQIPISLYRDNKKIKEHCGDIGFTHKGISGPGIIDFSRYFQIHDVLTLNLTKTNEAEVLERWQQTIHTQGKTTVNQFFKPYDIPKSLILYLCAKLNIPQDHPLAILKKQDKIALINAFCQFPIPILSIGGFDRAMVTTGGISLEEINPKTMESTLIPRLFFVGEVLDIDGNTGGYNLQAAFSTGFLAGNTIQKLI